MEAAEKRAIVLTANSCFFRHQDALFVGGKVQAPVDFPDHVVFRNPELVLGLR